MAADAVSPSREASGSRQYSSRAGQGTGTSFRSEAASAEPCVLDAGGPGIAAVAMKRTGWVPPHRYIAASPGPAPLQRLQGCA
eukprot:scaffold4913_cov111-Isochrysis_galbana.AAC.4